MDIQPLSKGHALIIPKYHGEKLADIPDEHLTELLVCVTTPISCTRSYGLGKLTTRTQPVAKKIAIASGAKDYNILQNNGKIAHQEVGHVHVHIIPKPNETEGLGIGWPMQKLEMDELKALAEQIKSKV
ncbi:hypothetical protein FJTKL_14972 [Diaporthe vaccinii]